MWGYHGGEDEEDGEDEEGIFYGEDEEGIFGAWSLELAISEIDQLVPTNKYLNTIT